MKKIFSVLVLISVLVASSVAEARRYSYHHHHYDRDDLIELGVGVLIGGLSTALVNNGNNVQPVVTGVAIPVVVPERICNNVMDRSGAIHVECVEKYYNTIYR